MHDDQIDSSSELVRRLLADQLPQLAGRAVRHVRSTGTANALYRIGDDLLARLPLRPSTSWSIENEHRWLPHLALHLPLEVPRPVAIGRPADEFPWPWSVLTWVDGADATDGSVDPGAAAEDLGRFVAELQSIEPPDGPEPDPVPFGRGVPLRERDDLTRRLAPKCAGLVDVHAVLAAWDQALDAPEWDGPPVWVHGDLSTGNLVVRDGRLAGVIDWNSMCLGDPAADAMVAWELFDEARRDRYRIASGADDATWERGKGWALTTAVVALPYYVGTNRFMVDQALTKIAAVLGDGTDRPVARGRVRPTPRRPVSEGVNEHRDEVALPSRGRRLGAD